MSETTQKPILGTSVPNRLVVEGRIFNIRPPKLNEWGARKWITRALEINTSTDPRYPNPVVIEFEEKHRGILEPLERNWLVRVLVNIKTRTTDSGGDFHTVTGFHVEALNKAGEWRVVPCNKATALPPNMTSEAAAALQPEPEPDTQEEGDDLPF